MSGVAPALPRKKFTSSSGAPLANGTLTAYVAGSTTLTDTWQDSALSTLNTNPIVLDANGECDLWLDPDVVYDFVLKNASGVTQWTVDNVYGTRPWAIDGINITKTGQYYTEDGAKVSNMADRLLVGAATANAGSSAIPGSDWLSIFQTGKSRPGGPAIHFATLGVLNDTNANGSSTFVAGSQTKDLPTGASGIAISGYSVNNSADSTKGGFSCYLESVRESGALGGSYGAEIDVANYQSLVSIDPYQQNGGQSIAAQLAAGAELSATGQFSVSAAINIRNNHATFDKGIIFGSDALAGADGTTGTATAIALGKGHGLSWYSGAGVGTSSIYCDGSTAAGGTALHFGESFVAFQNSSGAGLLSISNSPSVVNYPTVSASTTGNAVQYGTAGSDANIDLALVTTGTGVVKFGTYTAGAVAQAGYITIKDSGGTTRRLLVG